jgi:hypothetical protein
MEQNGYTAKIEDVSDLTDVKARYQVPAELQSCHTAIVDGYVVEGHVPVAEIERLLLERPAFIGLSVPGMPVGSPGMETGGASQPYKVIAFDASGETEVYASYPK